jgi:hypothetical protein
MMKKKFLVASMIAAFLLAAGTVRAQGVDQKIQVLEQELMQLKEQQVELKKEATAAVAAMPTFEYRPGSGVRMEAADKAWSLQLSHEIDWLMAFESGQSHGGRPTGGQVMTRRFRQEWTLCVDNCFYEVQSRLDLDGWGTNSALQRAQGLIHFENLNPWLPTLYFGGDMESFGGVARQGSSATGSQGEYDMLSRNNGFNTGRTGSGVGFYYQNIPLTNIGIPGQLPRLSFTAGTIGGQDDANLKNSNHLDYSIYGSIQPFSQIKNKWLQGFTFEMLAWFCNNDKHLEETAASSTTLGINSTSNGFVTVSRIDINTTEAQDANSRSACSSLNIRDHGPGGRQSLFNSGPITGGAAHYLQPGISWEVGPYRLRAQMGFQHYQDVNSLDSVRVRQRVQESVAATGGNTAVVATTSTTNLGSVGSKGARNFMIGHDLFLWSPKGFLTGDSNTKGSVLFGTHFERTDVHCNVGGQIRDISTSNDIGASATCNRITITAATSRPEFTRNRILVREWDLWYFIAPRASVGVNVLWYDASNLPGGHTFGGGLTNDVQKALGASGSCRNSSVDTTGFGNWAVVKSGCGGNWLDAWLRLRWSF